MKSKNEETEEQKKQLALLTTELAKKDRNIGKCEKKIYQLKKKTQELEKFKYVLDYKIKELKKDIAPREQEIMNLKMDTNNMDKKLREFNKTNAKLGYLVDSLRIRQKEMQKMIKKTRVKIQTNQIYIRTFENAVYWVAQEIDDHDKLKKSI